MNGLHGEVEQDHADNQREQRGLRERDGQPRQCQERQRQAGHPLAKTLVGPATGSSGGQGAGDTGQAKQADGGMGKRQRRGAQGQDQRCPEHGEGGEDEQGEQAPYAQGRFGEKQHEQ
ncbi:hypothetical protein D3C73_967830 [compost metagenome]